MFINRIIKQKIAVIIIVYDDGVLRNTLTISVEFRYFRVLFFISCTV